MDIQAIKAHGSALLEKVDSRLAQVEALNAVEAKTGVKRLHMFLGVSGLLVCFLLFGLGAGPVCNLVGFIYPTYAAFKAVKSIESKDDTQWLTYFVVYGAFSMGESLADMTFSLVPLYYLAKCALLVYMFLPQTQGAKVIFDVVLDPLITKIQGAVDLQVNRAPPQTKKTN